MTPNRDVASTLRAVSQLRRLCLSLPHVPTSAEQRLLARFDQLAASPNAANAADVDALAVGWRAWWRAGRTAEIAAMAATLPPTLIGGDRRLATYAVAASASVRAGGA